MNLELETEIGNRNWKLKLETRSANWNWKLEWEAVIGNWNLKLELGSGLGSEVWDLRKEMGTLAGGTLGFF